MAKSRTYSSIKNSSVALIMYLATFILQFIYRKVFIDYIGEDILGLNSTISSILEFLNLAELGIGAAVAYTLYTPLREKDNQQINEIISIQGWLYKRIGFIVLFFGLILLPFFPLIFEKTDLPLWYPYSTFLVLLTSTILSYNISYKQILLSADQQEYKIQLTYKLSRLIKITIQIIAIKVFAWGYISWLIIELLFAFISCLLVNKAVYKSFPFLKIDTKNIKLLLKKHPSIKTKTSQIFFHKFASFALTQLSPIILFAYTSLTDVATYGNYTMITTGIMVLLTALFNGLNASVGNLVAEGNKIHILRIFRELFSFRFCIVASCTLCIYFLSSGFMSIWIGERFVLNNHTTILICILFFLNTMRTIVDSFIQAYGLYKDIFAPIIEASINIGLSILLGYFWGLNGILIGVITSLIVIVYMWKPFFLFKYGLKHKLTYYIKLYLKHLFIFSISIVLINYIVKYFSLHTFDNYIEFSKNAVIIIFLCITFIVIPLCIIEQGMKDFMKRMIQLVKSIVR